MISEVLDLAAAISAEGHLDGAASVRSRLAGAVQTAKAAARNEVRPDKDISLANQGVVAWIDEVMLDYPEWGRAAPNLQGELLGTQVARETFFTNLEGLGDGQDEVRELYYLILCLGFQGYYGELSSSERELERLMDVHGRLLTRQPTSVAALEEERLTAQPYGVEPPAALAPSPATPPAPPPTVAPLTMASPRWGLILALALPLLALVLVAGFLLLPLWLNKQVSAKLEAIDCAHLEATVGFDRVARLQGYVPSQADRASILAGVSRTFGLAGVEGDVAVHPEPFCLPLEDAWPHASRNDREQLGARIGLADPSQPLRHRYSVVVEAITPRFDGYLYVFYIHSDGGVVPLLPNSMLENNRHDAGARVLLGEEDSPFRLQRAPPFGTDMRLLYATSEPLLSGPPVDYHDDIDRFVDEVREGLRAVQEAGGQTAASFSFVETKP